MAKIILYLFCLLLTASVALACSCIQPSPPQESLEQATAVFAGRVTNIEKPFISTSSLDPITATFDVSQVWKGDITQTVAIRTAQDSASCGYPFELGQEYIVYAWADPDHPGELNTGLCSRTNLLFQAQEDVQALGQSLQPAVDEPENNSILRISLMGVIVLAVALGIHEYRRKREPKKESIIKKK